MKKIVLLIAFITCNLLAIAQHEGRIGTYIGVHKTMLTNAGDKNQKDLLPTYNLVAGLNAEYLFTAFKALPLGVNFQLSYGGKGQQYMGYYTDSSLFYGTAALRYYHAGLGLVVSTNILKKVQFVFGAGATIGFLERYKETFKYLRKGYKNYEFTIQGTDISINDTIVRHGVLNQPIYKKNDFGIYSSLGLEFQTGQRIIFGFHLRGDMGMSPIENTTDNLKIKYIDEGITTYENFDFFKTKAKHHKDPTATTAIREKTSNTSFGVNFTLKYRFYNPENIQPWYKFDKY